RQRLANVFFFQVWISLENFRRRLPGRHQSDNRPHRDPHSANAGFTAHDGRIARDTCQTLHPYPHDTQTALLTPCGTLESMAANLVPAAVPIAGLAQSPGVRECLQWFTREKQWINEIHLELCRIPAPTFLEGQRAEWMAAQLRGFGWKAHIDRAGNVVAFLNE